MPPHRLRLTAFVLGLLVLACVAVPAAAGGGGRFSGRLVRFHGDDFARPGRAVAGFALETERGHYRLTFRDTSLAGLVGRRIEVSGSRTGRTVDVAAYRALPEGADSTGSATTSIAAQNKNVAVLLMNFRNDTRQPWTADHVAGVMFGNANSVANYFAEQSYGNMAMTGQVFGWYTLDVDNAGCDFNGWGSAVRAAALAAGENLNGFTNFVYAFPSASGCGWSGLAYLPGVDSWLNNAMTMRVASHELSHNFGVHHASTYNCVSGGVRVTLSATANECTLNEYGDPFTVMGSASWRHSNAWHKAQMGWAGAAADRLDVTVEGTYTLGSQEFASATPKLLRVARAGASGQFFYLELRQPFGTYFDNFTASDPVVNGVTVRIGADYNVRSQSRLLDTTPLTSSFGDAALAVGQTFSDPLSGVTVTTQSVSGGSAAVHVSFDGVVPPPQPPPDTTPPTAPTNLRATVNKGGVTALAWNASSDNVAVTGYRLYRNGSLFSTVRFKSAGTLDMPQGPATAGNTGN